MRLWVALGRLGEENSWEQGLGAAVSRRPGIPDEAGAVGCHSSFASESEH